MIKSVVLPKTTKVKKEMPMMWHTKTGGFKTSGSAKVVFQLPEFTTKRTTLGKFQVNANPSTDPYNVIMGRDLMHNLD